MFINSVYKRDRSYYPQALLKECKNFVNDKEIKKSITKNFIISENETVDERLYESESEYESENESS